MHKHSLRSYRNVCLHRPSLDLAAVDYVKLMEGDPSNSFKGDRGWRGLGRPLQSFGDADEHTKLNTYFRSLCALHLTEEVIPSSLVLMSSSSESSVLVRV